MSSTEQRMALADARALAERLVAEIADACETVTIAGSIRRQKPDVGDLEVVCVPKVETVYGGLFGDVPETADWLAVRVDELLEAGVLGHRLDKNGRKAAGNRYRRLLYRGVPCDLFSPDPGRCSCSGTIQPIRSSPDGGDCARRGEPENRQDVPSLRGSVPGAADQLELLQPELRSHGVLRRQGDESDKELPGHLQGMREGVSEEVLLRETRPRGLHDSVRYEDSAQPSSCSEVDRVPPEYVMGTGATGQGSLRQDLSPTTPQCVSEGGFPGASGGDGAPHRALPGVVREGSPSERHQERQPDRESGDRDAGSTERRRDLSPLSSELPGALNGKCSQCGKPGWFAPSYGAILAIRTGPSEYSHRLVTPRSQGGLMPDHLQMREGSLRYRVSGQPIPTPDEAAFFEALGLPFIAPEQRG